MKYRQNFCLAVGNAGVIPYTANCLLVLFVPFVFNRLFTFIVFAFVLYHYRATLPVATPRPMLSTWITQYINNYFWGS
jgi:hypothetical protein